MFGLKKKETKKGFVSGSFEDPAIQERARNVLGRLDDVHNKMRAMNGYPPVPLEEHFSNRSPKPNIPYEAADRKTAEANRRTAEEITKMLAEREEKPQSPLSLTTEYPPPINPFSGPIKLSSGEDQKIPQTPPSLEPTAEEQRKINEQLRGFKELAEKHPAWFTYSGPEDPTPPSQPSPTDLDSCTLEELIAGPKKREKEEKKREKEARAKKKSQEREARQQKKKEQRDARRKQKEARRLKRQEQRKKILAYLRNQLQKRTIYASQLLYKVALQIVTLPVRATLYVKNKIILSLIQKYVQRKKEIERLNQLRKEHHDEEYNRQKTLPDGVLFKAPEIPETSAANGHSTDKLVPLRVSRPFLNMPPETIWQVFDKFWQDGVYCNKDYIKMLEHFLQKAEESAQNVTGNLYLDKDLLAVLNAHYPGCSLAPLFIGTAPRSNDDTRPDNNPEEITDRISRDYFLLLPDIIGYIKTSSSYIGRRDGVVAKRLAALQKAVPLFQNVPDQNEQEGNGYIVHTKFSPERVRNGFPNPAAYCRLGETTYPVFHRDDLPALRKALRRHVNLPPYSRADQKTHQRSISGIQLATSMQAVASATWVAGSKLVTNGLSNGLENLYVNLTLIAAMVPAAILFTPRAPRYLRALAAAGLAAIVSLYVASEMLTANNNTSGSSPHGVLRKPNMGGGSTFNPTATDAQNGLQQRQY